jgi:enamine deaminase RidA (YjgF/YER057c/UK114 family)
MSVSSRLAELGIELPAVAAPLASYVPATRSGSYVYTSGQLPLVGGELIAAGKVGSDIDEATAHECARMCILNAIAAAAETAGGVDRILRIVKVVGFVASDPSFSGQPAVINGASDLLGEIFGDAGVHARSAVGVAVLPKDAPVEIEMIVEVAE